MRGILRFAKKATVVTYYLYAPTVAFFAKPRLPHIFLAIYSQRQGGVKPTDALKTCLKKVKAGEDIGSELKILKEHLLGWNIIISLATIEQNKQAIEVLNSIEKELREKADKENVDAVCDYVAFLKQKADFISFYAQRRLNTHLKEKHSARAFLCSYRLFKNDQDAKTLNC